MEAGAGENGLRGDLAKSLWDGVCFSLMVGLGETYLAAFALALGHGPVLAGLVATVPMLAGSVLQLATPRAVHWLGSRKRWVVACAFGQALVFLPLCAAALVGALPAFWLFAAAAGYWAAGLGTGPAWTAWVPSMVPRRIRSSYFAYRTRAAQAAVLVGLIGGGLLLNLADSHGRPLLGFAGIFAVAAICRLASTALLSSQSEGKRPPPHSRPLAFGPAFVRMAGGEHRRIFTYLLAVQVAVQVSAPYFTPYMLGPLELSYGSYVLMVAAAYLARAVSLPFWGRLAHRTGAARLLWIGGLGITPSAVPWILTDDLRWLFLSQLYAGIVWAAYELAVFLVLFDRLNDEERTSLLALYNFANAIALATGSLCGGWLLSHLGPGPTPFLVLFGLSTALRFSVLFLRPPLRQSEGLPASEPLGTRTIAVRPSLGGIDRPILPPEEEPAPAEQGVAGT